MKTPGHIDKFFKKHMRLFELGWVYMIEPKQNISWKMMLPGKTKHSFFYLLSRDKKLLLET